MKAAGARGQFRDKNANKDERCLKRHRITRGRWSLESISTFPQPPPRFTPCESVPVCFFSATPHGRREKCVSLRNHPLLKEARWPQSEVDTSSDEVQHIERTNSIPT